MGFYFATCERQRALEFIRTMYPGKTITDTPESAGPLLDFVEADIVRVTDPSFHACQIIPATHWDESRRADVVAACERFHK